MLLICTSIVNNADTNSPVYKILEDLSSNAAQFQNEAMQEVGKKSMKVDQMMYPIFLEGIQSGDYSKAFSALGYGVAEGIGTSHQVLLQV